MQYIDYIAQYNARRERAEQLAKRYNQKPASQKINQSDMGPKELLGIVLSIIIVALILILAIR